MRRWLIDPLIDWSIDRLIPWLIDTLIDWFCNLLFSAGVAVTYFPSSLLIELCLTLHFSPLSGRFLPWIHEFLPVSFRFVFQDVIQERCPPRRTRCPRRSPTTNVRLWRWWSTRPFLNFQRSGISRSNSRSILIPPPARSSDSRISRKLGVGTAATCNCQSAGLGVFLYLDHETTAARETLLVTACFFVPGSKKFVFSFSCNWEARFYQHSSPCSIDWLIDW